MDDEKRWCEAGCKRNRQHFEIYPKEDGVRQDVKVTDNTLRFTRRKGSLGSVGDWKLVKWLSIEFVKLLSTLLFQNKRIPEFTVPGIKCYCIPDSSIAGSFCIAKVKELIFFLSFLLPRISIMIGFQGDIHGKQDEGEVNSAVDSLESAMDAGEPKY
ncbi:hypothetical protein IFM89_024456 [Coptis chinensis]|uniref:Uncharacterized protein n=1 Tax=Coptis chinensis TaxID=261450 RepID=A0A835H677_9MAGN|nr:hypothetical protein IFM89_024456 [Coptis chinensis]